MLTTLTENGVVEYMVSRIVEICDAYESGIGHGVKNDNLPAPYGDTELNEAYMIGYGIGQNKLLEYYNLTFKNHNE